MSIFDRFRADPSLPPPIEEGSRARAFVYEDKIIVTSVIEIFDGPEPIVLPQDVEDALLGETIYNCVKAYRTSRTREKFGRTLKEWPAFRVSGAKTVRKFEQSVLDVLIDAKGLALIISARPYQTLRPHLSMQSVAAMKNREHDELGKAFRQAIAGARVLREQGIL